MIKSIPFCRTSIALSAFLLIVAFLINASNAADKADMGGWEPGSPYNRLYNASERDSLKGHIVKIEEVVPMDGMAPGVVAHVREAEDEVVAVHICPVWYISAAGTGLKKGDRVKVKGAWAEINGEDVFLAAKISIEDFFVLKVRLTKDGRPFWSMSEEELAREKTAVGSK